MSVSQRPGRTAVMRRPRLAGTTTPEVRTPSPAWLRKVSVLTARDGDECWLCGWPLDGNVTLDHVIPRSKGGGNGVDNLRLAHAECNVRAPRRPVGGVMCISAGASSSAGSTPATARPSREEWDDRGPGAQ